MLAVSLDQEKIVNYLIIKGANVDQENEKGKTALIVAIEKENENMITLLLKKGSQGV